MADSRDRHVHAIVSGSAAGAAAVAVPFVTMPALVMACLTSLVIAGRGRRLAAVFVSFITVVAMVIVSNPWTLGLG